MAKVTAFEAKTRFGELLDRVADGEEVVITRHDKPVARLVPEGAQPLDEVRRAVDGLRALQERIRRRSRARLTSQVGVPGPGSAPNAAASRRKTCGSTSTGAPPAAVSAGPPPAVVSPAAGAGSSNARRR